MTTMRLGESPVFVLPRPRPRTLTLAVSQFRETHPGSSTYRRPRMSYNRYPVGLQGWQDTEPFLKQLEQSMAAMSASSHRAALMVSAIGTGNCFHPSSCRLSVTIRAASLTPTWAGLGRSTTPECSATAHCTGVHSTLLQGISSSSSSTPTPPHHSLQEANTRCGSPALQQPSLQGTIHYRACFWDDEDQVPGHLPASAGGAPHLCTSREYFLYCTNE